MEHLELAVQPALVEKKVAVPPLPAIFPCSVAQYFVAEFEATLLPPLEVQHEPLLQHFRAVPRAVFADV